MPLPLPTNNETEQEFIQRCMNDDIMMNEYPDTNQRHAICKSQFNDKKKIVDYEMLEVFKKKHQKNKIIRK